MTTIAYDHKLKQIAVDGQVVGGSTIVCTDFQKWIQDGDDWWFLCGHTADQQRLIDHINAKDPDAPKWPIDASAFLVRDGMVFQCLVTDKGEPLKSPLLYSDALGSGQYFAVSAMDHGKDAKGAVEYAATRDTGTGGVVSVFDIARMEISREHL